MTKTKNIKILIASGVNMDLLGRRETQIYGTNTLADMEDLVTSHLKKISDKNFSRLIKLDFFQSNDEEKFLRKITSGFDGVVINAGAWTHTSLAIADRLAGLGIPYVEVHISDLKKRESFRQFSYLSAHAIAVVQGLGIKSYAVGLEMLMAALPSRLSGR